MKERTKRLQALFCALAVTATSVGSPLVSVPYMRRKHREQKILLYIRKQRTEKQQIHQTMRYQKVRIR